MPYATQQDLVDRFGAQELIQLTDRTNRPPTTVDVVVVNRALTDATALVDGYLAKVYTLPLSVVPPSLVKINADVARYYLHGKSADKDSAVTRAFNEAVSWLKDVAKGLVSIGADGIAPVAAGGGSVKANPSTRLFTRDSLRNF
jgi:phage gp36-like protein